MADCCAVEMSHIELRRFVPYQSQNISPQQCLASFSMENLTSRWWYWKISYMEDSHQSKSKTI